MWLKKNQKFFSRRSGAHKSKIKGVRRVSFLRSFSPWLVDGDLPVCLSGLPSMHVCILISSSYKDTRHNELGLTPMTSFKLSYSSKSLISKYSHIPRYQELGFQHMILGVGGRCDSAHYSRLLRWQCNSKQPKRRC